LEIEVEANVTSFQANKGYNISCTVKGSYPAPNISWWTGADQVLETFYQVMSFYFYQLKDFNIKPAFSLWVLLSKLCRILDMIYSFDCTHKFVKRAKKKNILSHSILTDLDYLL